MTTELAGWAATVITLYGSYLVGNKCKIGFVCQIVGSSLWAYVGYMHGPPSLVVVSLAFALLYTRNFLIWSNHDNKRKILRSLHNSEHDGCD